MFIKKTNSKAYFATLDLTCEKDLDTLYDIRLQVSRKNRSSKKRLSVKAKPVKSFDGRNERDKHGNIIGGMDNARLVDVYIY